MRKTVDTPFTIREGSIRYSGTLFAPVGELNRVRREFLDQAGEALLASSVPAEDGIRQAHDRVAAAFPEQPAAPPVPGRDSGTALPFSLVVYVDTAEAAGAALEEGCTGICFEPSF